MTTKNSSALNILVLEGDGIGPEISAATLAVLRAADQKFALGLTFETRRNRLGSAPRGRHDVPPCGT